MTFLIWHYLVFFGDLLTKYSTKSTLVLTSFIKNNSRRIVGGRVHKELSPRFSHSKIYKKLFLNLHIYIYKRYLLKLYKQREVGEGAHN